MFPLIRESPREKNPFAALLELLFRRAIPASVDRPSRCRDVRSSDVGLWRPSHGRSGRAPPRGSSRHGSRQGAAQCRVPLRQARLSHRHLALPQTAARSSTPMLRREHPHSVEREYELEIQRLFRPQRPVIVESRDALGDRDEIGRAFLRHLLDERYDGLLRAGVVPRRQRIGGEGGANRLLNSSTRTNVVLC